ncbi:MAG: hypothetical protein JRH20_22740 [Deltaproteobacteria bacterium]|nr:hypothetical protein [Deltaproteobacteria bacterium]
MRYCAFCANEVTDEVTSCPFCGKRMPKSATAGGTEHDKTKAAAVSPPGPPATYPLPMAGEGATVRGFAPVMPPTAQEPAYQIGHGQRAPTSEPTLPAMGAPGVMFAPISGEVSSSPGGSPADPPAAPIVAPIVAPTITVPPNAESATQAEPGGAFDPISPPPTTVAMDSGVSPMPPAPLGLMGCLPYVFAVMSARRLRASAVRNLHVQIEGEKQKIHEALRDLGQSARRAANSPALAHEEINRLIALEEDRGQAEAAKGALDAQLAAEEERFEQSERGHRSAADAHRAELTSAQGDLDQVNTEINRQQQVLTEADQQGQALKKERQSAESQAQKTLDVAEKEALIRSAAEKDVALDDLAQRRHATETALATASAPKAALEQRVIAAQTGLDQAQAAITTARQELNVRRKEIDKGRREGGMQVTQLEREIMHAQVVVGGVLNTHRSPSEDGSFEEHYGRIDGHHRMSDEKMRRISALETEGDGYDRDAHKKGLILLGSLIGLFTMTVLILVLVL